MKFTKPQAATDPVIEIASEEVFDKAIPTVSTTPAAYAPKAAQEFKRTAVTTVNVRKEPSKDSTSLGVLYANSEVSVEVFDNDWYKVTAGDYKGGYVRKAFLK